MRPKARVIATGRVWIYGSKVYWDNDGTYLQFALEMPLRGHAKNARTRIYVQWYVADFYPKKGDWVECTGILGGSMVKENIETVSASITLLCWRSDVKLLESK